MKALTICQPYAELIARGEKLVENRTWYTAYRGPLLIHAGKSRAWLSEGDSANLPFGAVVAVARVVACLRTSAPNWGRMEHLRSHAHTHGPLCWVLEDVTRLREPVFVNGAQGLWEPSSELVARVSAQMAEAGHG